MSFWPEDIAAVDVTSPREIMELAGDELGRRTDVLTVRVGVNRLLDRFVLRFIVMNEILSLKYNLFEASHQLHQTYPVVIDPTSSDVPEFLQRERYIPGEPGLTSTIHPRGVPELARFTHGSRVENEWVCATPTEFTKKLRVLFASDHVKSRIIGLQAPIRSVRAAEESPGPASSVLPAVRTPAAHATSRRGLPDPESLIELRPVPADHLGQSQDLRVADLGELGLDPLSVPGSDEEAVGPSEAASPPRREPEARGSGG